MVKVWNTHSFCQKHSEDETARENSVVGRLIVIRLFKQYGVKLLSLKMSGACPPSPHMPSWCHRDSFALPLLLLCVVLLASFVLYCIGDLRCKDSVNVCYCCGF